jgi:hypothetical protein
LAAAAAVIVVEHPPVPDRVAQLHSACGQCVFVDVLALAVDPPELTGLAAVVVLADEDLDLLGESSEAAVEVRGGA